MRTARNASETCGNYILHGSARPHQKHTQHARRSVVLWSAAATQNGLLHLTGDCPSTAKIQIRGARARFFPSRVHHLWHIPSLPVSPLKIHRKSMVPCELPKCGGRSRTKNRCCLLVVLSNMYQFEYMLWIAWLTQFGSCRCDYWNRVKIARSGEFEKSNSNTFAPMHCQSDSEYSIWSLDFNLHMSSCTR